MVCEVCGSNTIKKIGDVFVCQECGVEYSLEAVKNLLVEVESDTNPVKTVTPQNLNIGVGDDKVKHLAAQIRSWGALCLLAENLIKISKNTKLSTTENSFWLNNQRDSFIPLTFSEYSFKDVKVEVDKSIENNFVLDSKSKTIKEKLDRIRGITDSDLEEGDVPGESKYVYRIRKKRATKDLGGVSELYDSRDKYLGFEELVNDYIELGYEYEICRANVKHPIFKAPYVELSSTYGPEFDIQYLIKYLACAKKQEKQIKQDFEMTKKEIYNEYVTDFENLKKIYADILKTGTNLETIFSLPIKYRSPSHCAYFLELLIDGRAENWKELVNLFETIIHRENIERSLSNIIKTFDNLNYTVLQGFKLVNAHFQSVNDNICDISKELKTISSKIDEIDTTVDVSVYLEVK